MKQLSKKTIVVTGCLQGIGRATMDMFARNGANIFACSLKQTEEFEAHIEELKNECGTQIIPVYFDMMDDDSIKNAVKEIQKAKLPIDGLINIAGITKDAIFQMVKMDDMRTTYQVNVFSQVLFSQYIVKLMQRHGNGGSIVFTSSISGLEGRSGQLSYASSKAAVVAVAKTMAAELGASNIRVNTIAPGFINTDMYKDVPKDIIEQKVGKTALKRMGTPDEIANVLMFLASDSSSHITGQVIRIDGGKGI